MSHIVQIQTEVRDSVAVGLACHRLNLENPNFAMHELFSTKVEGWGVRLPGWTSRSPWPPSSTPRATAWASRWAAK